MKSELGNLLFETELVDKDSQAIIFLPSFDFSCSITVCLLYKHHNDQVEISLFCTGHWIGWIENVGWDSTFQFFHLIDFHRLGGKDGSIQCFYMCISI